MHDHHDLILCSSTKQLSQVGNQSKEASSSNKGHVLRIMLLIIRVSRQRE